MKQSNHITEEDLIAYRLHEAPDEAAIRKHLEHCAECAALSESIAETLRVFSADPLPRPDLEKNWRQLRGSLTVLSEERRQPFAWLQPRALRPRWMLSAGACALAALLLAAFFLGPVRWRLLPANQSRVANVRGPLTEQPTDPAMANHLDAAERFLTEVNNSQGPLDPSTKEQAHSLSLKNAIYVQQARSENDLGEATVLENLGRVLTAVDHEGATAEAARDETSGYRRREAEADEKHTTLGVRLEMNTTGLLLELRVLRQNDKAGQ